MTHRVPSKRIGWFGAEIGRDNKARVRDFFERHIGATKSECASALGLSPMAVGRHIIAIRAEWEPTAAFKLGHQYPSKRHASERHKHDAGRTRNKGGKERRPSAEV